MRYIKGEEISLKDINEMIKYNKETYNCKLFTIDKCIIIPDKDNFIIGDPEVKLIIDNCKFDMSKYDTIEFSGFIILDNPTFLYKDTLKLLSGDNLEMRMMYAKFQNHDITENGFKILNEFHDYLSNEIDSRYSENGKVFALKYIGDSELITDSFNNLYDHVPSGRIINFLKYDNNSQRGTLNDIYPDSEGDYGKISIMDFGIKEFDEYNILHVDFLYSGEKLYTHNLFPILSIMSKNKPIKICLNEEVVYVEDTYEELKVLYPHASISENDSHYYYIKKYIQSLFLKYPKETLLKTLKESIMENEKEGVE